MTDTGTPSASEVSVTAPKKSATSGIPTFRPQIKVTLDKNIGRSTVGASIGVSQRFAGAKRQLDLTKYLGDTGMVTTSRSTRRPAGMFNVTFADQMEPDQQESFYGLIEPLDLITISIARDASVYGGVDKMPIRMRGFVTNVRRETSMTATGPRRSVVVTGQDYGKILQIMRIVYLPGYVLGQDLLTPYNLFLNYGVGAESNQPIGDFLQQLLDKVVNPFLQGMIKSSGYTGPDQSPVLQYTLDNAVTKGVVSPFGAQSFNGGSVYELMKYFGDVGPWNELYTEDRPDGPYLVFRPTPFKDLSGALIQGGSPPSSYDVLDPEIISISVERSDSDVANYYWVGAPRFSLVDPSLLQLSAIAGQDPAPFVKDYPNCSPDFYGVRLLQIDTQEGPRFDGQAQGDVDSGKQTLMSFIDDRRDTLIKNNRDNVVLEHGSLAMRGNEKITAGSYINLVRGPGSSGNFEAQYYAHTVTDQFVPMRQYTTQIEFDRGMGFAGRLQKGSGTDSPYLGELNLTGAYGNA